MIVGSHSISSLGPRASRPLRATYSSNLPVGASIEAPPNSDLSAADMPAVLVKSCVLALCAIALLGIAIGVRSVGEKNRSAKLNFGTPISRADQTDSDLTSAAKGALGNREGTIIVMDPRTGRIRAVANPQIAFEAAFAPGSTIKPFTTLAALRSGTIAKDSRMLCREHYSHADLDTVCSHPRNLPPLKPAEALAYSCNYYFGKLSEQVSDSTLRNTLAEFGFGQPTKVHSIGGREVAGTLEYGPWRAQTALGEGAQIEISPIQLLTGYSALVNGGHLFVPQIAPEGGFVTEQQKELSIDEEHRRLILEGMRGAVRYGTAERAKLYSLPLYIIGKTGTATLKGGFRTHGWFVGFASPISDSYAMQDPDLAVIVFLKRAHGADAAEIARPIFESYIRSETRELVAHETVSDQPESNESAVPQGQNTLLIPNTTVRVHLVRENVTRTMPLENYILGVVAAEGSTETEVEALKALALASRTYAVKNLRRHETEGYDFCTTTHCQRYVDLSSRTNGSQIQVASQAVSETTGQVLHDNDGRIVDAYFSASCGGATANLKAIWGTAAPYYLAGTSDEYCLTMPHHSWTDIISAANLLRALENDPRTEVGGKLTSVTVAKRDASGRAELITIDGARRRIVKGWDFKIIVGRALGWNLLKSSRFEVFRSGSNFIFRGSGFGHGLGLCQEGAHVMARRGAGYRQILSKYFPGTRVGTNGERARGGDAERGRWGEEQTQQLNAGDAQRHSSRSHHAVSASPRRTLTSEHFRLSYPGRLSLRDAEHVLKVFESSRDDLIRRVSTGVVSFQLPTLEVFINESTGDFVGRTGQPSWVAAATLQNRIELQPFDLLTRRRILEATIRHELVHAAIEALSRGRSPRWLSEGLALHVAGEGPSVLRYLGQSSISKTELENRFSTVSNANDMRVTYAAAYFEVKRLISVEGEAAVWRRVAEGR